MKSKFSKATGMTVALILVGSAYFAGVRAQQSPAKPGAIPVTTNWTGYLVVGKNDSADSINAAGPSPTVTREVEIGLRSDGVVVWRNALSGN